jgi:hypothetical protein
MKRMQRRKRAEAVEGRKCKINPKKKKLKQD